MSWRVAVAIVLFAPLVVLAVVFGGWVGLILCAMFGAIVAAVVLDDRA